MSSRVPRRRRGRLLGVLLLIGLVVTAGAVVTNTFGAGDRWERVVARVGLFLDPPPHRDTRPTVTRPRAAVAPAGSVTAPTAPPPTVAPARASAPPSGAASGSSPVAAVATARATDRPGASATPSATASAIATPPPTPTPRRVAVDVSIAPDPDAVFAHQLDKKSCAVAATQIVLAMLGLGDTSDRFQQQIAGRIDEWESWQDSHDGGWGPAAIAEALAAYGEPDYEIRAYPTRDDALLDAAIAISETGKPVVLLTWRGAHTWVMTGYRASGNPLVFADAKVTHAQILDPWYPWVSTIWGPSDAPGHYEVMAEMERNYLPWERPEGDYPDRDGQFIAVVPTTPR